MRLEDIAITAVFLGIPIAIVVVSKGKHAKSLNRKAIKHKKEIEAEADKKVKEKARAEKVKLKKFKKEEEEFIRQNTPSFEYSKQELKFRRDIDLIQEIMPLAWCGCFIPNSVEIDSYKEVYQGSGISGDGDFYNIIIKKFPWIKIYEAFFNNNSFNYENIKVVSDGKITRILLNGNTIVIKEVIGDLSGILEIITLSDSGHKNLKTMLYLNRIIAAYGHNIIVDDAKENPRYGRVDIDKEIQYSERDIPWRIKNDFSKGEEVEMIDWTGSAKIEVSVWDEYNDPEDMCLKTTFFISGEDKPTGTMRSYAGYLVEDFNHYYPGTK